MSKTFFATFPSFLKILSLSRVQKRALLDVFSQLYFKPREFKINEASDKSPNRSEKPKKISNRVTLLLCESSPLQQETPALSYLPKYNNAKTLIQ
jgi:hypothetical protein